MLPVPARPAVPPTHAQVKAEKLYLYTKDICRRLLVSTHAAFAELDSYTLQWSFSGRTSTPEEENNQCPDLPAIIGDWMDTDLAKVCPVNPPPVVPADNDLDVEVRVRKYGNYNMSILRMTKASPNSYEYPTVDDNSAFDKFLSDSRGKLASFRKG
eukprot:16439178-Heterocapsa_arctica.AAC.1